MSTDSRGTRLNCWKMTPTRERAAPWRERAIAAALLHRLGEQEDFASRPCAAALPRSIAVRPAMARISVDLPEPDAPIRPTISPR